MSPSLIAQSRAECEHRLRALTRAAHASLFEPLLNDLLQADSTAPPPMASLRFRNPFGTYHRARPPPIRLHPLAAVRTDWLRPPPISMLQQELPWHLTFQLPPPQRRLACHLIEGRLRMPFPQRPHLGKHLLGPAGIFCLRLFPFDCGPPFALVNPYSSSTPFHPQNNRAALMQGNRASALSNRAAFFPPGQHDLQHCDNFVNCLRTKHTNNCLRTKHTTNSPNDTPEAAAFTPHAGAYGNGGKISATSGFPDRLQAT